MSGPLKPGWKDDFSLGKTWRQVLADDPCCWCGGPGGTIEHVHPKGTGRKKRHNGHIGTVVGACAECNSARGNKTILLFLYQRALVFHWKTGLRGVRPTRVGRRPAKGVAA